MQEKGFSDAFVVGYKNGKRVHISELVDESEFIPYKEDSTAVIQELDPNIEYSKDLVSIKIQVAVIKGEAGEQQKKQFNGMREVTFEFDGTNTKVYAGNFNNIDSAVEYQSVLIDQGKKDTFLVAFYNGESIKLSRAIQILDQ